VSTALYLANKEASVVLVHVEDEGIQESLPEQYRADSITDVYVKLFGDDESSHVRYARVLKKPHMPVAEAFIDYVSVCERLGVVSVCLRVCDRFID
jgi:hypothetical protein